MAILAGLREKYPNIESEQCVEAMMAAIDTARRITKVNPKKEYFSRWFGIFGRFETFHSLWEEGSAARRHLARAAVAARALRDHLDGAYEFRNGWAELKEGDIGAN